MNLEDAITKMIQGLSEIGVEYMLVGSFSSMYYSFPRSTTDADFVVGTQDLDVAGLSMLLGERFKFDPQISFETVLDSDGRGRHPSKINLGSAQGSR